MSRAARTADEAEAASKAAEDMTLVTYNYSFFHFVFALASMYLAMLMTGAPLLLRCVSHLPWAILGSTGAVSVDVAKASEASPHPYMSMLLCGSGRSGFRKVVLASGDLCASVYEVSALRLQAAQDLIRSLDALSATYLRGVPSAMTS